MAGLRRLLHQVFDLAYTPIRLFRQRTVVQLMVSHVAVVVLTFVLLNAIVVAVLIGWLPGRTLIGIETATQDIFLAERARGYAAWLDLGEIADEHGGLDSPEAREEIERRLTMMLNNTVPGFARPEQADPTGTGFIPQAAILTDTGGTVLASPSPDLASPEDAEAIRDPAVRSAVDQLVDQQETVDNLAMVTYTAQVSGDITGAAAPAFRRGGQGHRHARAPGLPIAGDLRGGPSRHHPRDGDGCPSGDLVLYHPSRAGGSAVRLLAVPLHLPASRAAGQSGRRVRRW